MPLPSITHVAYVDSHAYQEAYERASNAARDASTDMLQAVADVYLDDDRGPGYSARRDAYHDELNRRKDGANAK